MDAYIEVSQKGLAFEVKRLCRAFEFECFNFNVSIFGVILAERPILGLIREIKRAALGLDFERYPSFGRDCI